MFLEDMSSRTTFHTFPILAVTLQIKHIFLVSSSELSLLQFATKNCQSKLQISKLPSLNKFTVFRADVISVTLRFEGNRSFYDVCYQGLGRNFASYS